MKKILAILFGFMSLIFFTQVFAQEITGDELYRYCRITREFVDEDKNMYEPDQNSLMGICMEYVSVYGDNSDETSLRNFLEKHYPPKARWEEDRLYCMPDEVTTTTKIRLILNFMDDHPEYRKQDPVFIIWKALNTYYPCVSIAG